MSLYLFVESEIGSLLAIEWLELAGLAAVFVGLVGLGAVT